MKISRWRPKRPYRFLIASNLISFFLCVYIYSLLGRAGILLFYLPRFFNHKKKKEACGCLSGCIPEKRKKKKRTNCVDQVIIIQRVGGNELTSRCPHFTRRPAIHTVLHYLYRALLKIYIYLSCSSSRAPSHLSLLIFWLDYVVAPASRQQFIGRHRDISAGTWLERRRRWASPGCSADIPPVAIFPLLLQRCLWLWLYSPSLSLTGKDKTFK